jgi:Family of unknown function (DUF6507)
VTAWRVEPGAATAVIGRAAETGRAYEPAVKACRQELDDAVGAAGPVLAKAIAEFAEHHDARMRSVVERTDRILQAGRDVIAAYVRGDEEMVAVIQRAAGIVPGPDPNRAAPPRY